MSEEAPVSVAMVSAGFHPYIGGAERQALELSAALVARGVKVAVFTRRLPGLPARDVVRGVPVRRLWCAGGGVLNALTFMVSLFFRLWKDRRSFDAVHVHLAGSPALAAAFLGRVADKRVFVKLGGGRGIGELATAKGAAGKLKLRALSWLKPTIIAVTTDLAEESAAYLGPVPARVLPNGVDVRRYLPATAAEKAVLRERLGWPKRGTGFLYVGRLSPEKRLPLFLEIFAEVAKEVPSAFAVLVGDGPERPMLEVLKGRLGLGERILLHKSMEDAAPAYAAADVFVLPSVSEGLSNALLEAMSSGLAVLGSKVGGTAEAVEEGKSGLLFEAHDVEAFRRALKRLASEAGLPARLGEAGRRAALERFSLDKVAAACEALYRGREP